MNYTWTPATLNDVNDMVQLTESNFILDNTDLGGIDLFTPEPPIYARNLAYGVFNQTYYPGTELMVVARQNDNKQLLGYHWAKANDRTWWSDDPMINVRMVHLDLNLSSRLRVRLLNDMMDHWERFAHYSRNPVICSSTMRKDQDSFLRLHERRGYSVRGSFAYKRLDLGSVAPVN